MTQVLGAKNIGQNVLKFPYKLCYYTFVNGIKKLEHVERRHLISKYEDLDYFIGSILSLFWFL